MIWEGKASYCDFNCLGSKEFQASHSSRKWQALMDKTFLKYIA
ncbi:hypothetical protein EV13_2103 [Prochlorococcus sp. MIT 0702]|nr:hypothetical protein EV13_2103 [Prochlorococcus sp. MIT 0702]KGG27707.1 hypothetical protein EV12_1137 [Prochlorococcus sp. MIT 0701]KGG31946.1 hypothetical protein EV14_2154 [Prochlorococcus sp. MIT 0703]